MIHRSTLKGYILEELLARLIKQSGYSLLVDKRQDSWSLDGGGNGLRVHGRGADHQVDVLGELNVPIEFQLPIRLFLEAKCRTGRSDLRDVRNASGTIDDVNQFYTARDASSTPPPRRYQYRYALASTSGFTQAAAYYAVTHQITLVDLSGPSVQWLRDLVSRIANSLLKLARKSGLKKFPVSQMREAMRRALGTHPDAAIDLDAEDSISRPASRAATTPQPDNGLDPRRLARICADSAAEVHRRLFLAWTTSPFLVFLQPADDGRAIAAVRSAATTPGRQVVGRLGFVGSSPSKGQWALEAVNDRAPVSETREELRPRRRATGPAMTLLIPPELEPFLIEAEQGRHPEGGRAVRPAFNVQVAPETRAQILYEPVSLRDGPNSAESSEFGGDIWERLRASNWVEPVLDDDASVVLDEPTDRPFLWTEEAYGALIERLRSEGAPQAKIIEAAALDDGAVTRASVYRLANRAADMTLRGITKPALRVARDLVAEGLLDPLAAPPLAAVYLHGVKASHFVVPTEFTEYVDQGLHHV